MRFSKMMKVASRTASTAVLPALLSVLLPGCASQAPVASGPVLAITPQLLDAEQARRASPPAAGVGLQALAAVSPAPYTIGVGDVLAVVVWDHPELSSASLREQGDGVQAGPQVGFVVDQQGRIEFPYAGTVAVAGLTREQARAALATRLARYFREPRVTLQVQAYRSQRVYVDGEVKTPGLLGMDDIPMTVLEALNRSGGLLPTADQSRITLERGGVRHRLDLRGAGALPSAVLLRDGDLLRVPPRDESKVFVAGEVLAPRSLPMHDGRLTLNEALGEAGGLQPGADASQVYVVRHTPDGPRVYRLDARRAEALALAERFELQARDVVYVAASALTNWHRAISQLFPGELSSAVGVGRP
ncbi:polysaccharide biosynthesis/export family protein [Oxalobacteraceae bacterium A2-2]